MTSNIQLENYMKHKKTFAPFKGVFSSDKLPELKEKEPFCAIVNYDPSNKQGSHWCGIAYYNSTPMWFDSYGMKPDADDIVLDDTTHFSKFLKKHSGGKEIKYNKRDFQALESSTCGLWAVLFCLYGLPNETNKPWVYFKKQNQKYNDELVKKMINIEIAK